jgi:hypothetical protein
MSWVAQQRYVAWLVAGLAPAMLGASAAHISPPVAPSVTTATHDAYERPLTLSPSSADDLFDDPAPPAATQVAPQPPPPQPIDNPLPPALWSGLSVMALLGILLALRRLKAELR